MKSVAWLIPAVIVLAGPGCQPQTRPGADEGDRFTHGPMLGRVEAHTMGVWARTARSGKFAVRYGTLADKLDSLSPAVETRVERDNTGWVQLTGLDSGTRYRYRLVWLDGTEEVPGPGGTFHTLPSADDVRHPRYNPEGRFNFRFEFACGNNQNTGSPGAFGWRLPAFATMLAELQGADSRARIDFAILNGDWLYEEKRRYPPQDWLQQVGLPAGETPEVVKVMPNIVGVWENYKLYLDRGEHLPDWHRVVPSYFTFDDHEIVNVVSSVNFTIPHVGAYGPEPVPNKDDAWTVFLEEREDLIRFWDSLGKPVFVLTGDLHNSFAIKITDRVWEFASGPHNSSNHPLSSEGGRPTNGAYDSQGRRVEIRWSSFMQPDTPLLMRNRPVYCVVQVNNAFNNPVEEGTDRWVAYRHPQVIFQYYDGLTGELLYAESILAD